MDFPKTGDCFTILVKSLGSTVKRPKIFSLPILLRVSLPYPASIDWDLPLTLFKFKARELKFSSRGTKDFLGLWFADLWMGGILSRPLVALKIPYSPRLGREFTSEEFENRPDDLQSRVSDPDEEEGDPAPPYFSTFLKVWRVRQL